MLVVILPWRSAEAQRQLVKALYLPLADHYTAVVAYEKYGSQMKHADFRLEKMKSLLLMRAYFMSGDVDMTFIVSPMAMDMFREHPNFRWVSLMHRDGNAMAINDQLNMDAKLEEERIRRKPDARVADALVKAGKRLGKPSQVGIPHQLATHSVILYKYLKDQGKSLTFERGKHQDVLAIQVDPPRPPHLSRRIIVVLFLPLLCSHFPGLMWLRQGTMAMSPGIPRT
ncbi:ABC transporter substrate-binding protein [Dongshaea marina]|uniref:ABC transporter substrate-binding protein n=1 Tax=Dongshaea marina TaxID=2047966 RepID=UPI00131F487E|nr:ABC transporter substrate-binding protein [Dongshaea marina]